MYISVDINTDICFLPGRERKEIKRGKGDKKELEEKQRGDGKEVKRGQRKDKKETEKRQEEDKRLENEDTTNREWE